MGMGKTDVISPTVVSLIADGTGTLPILVMPESLVPSMSARLQERMEVAVRREVRVIPIDRVKHSATEVNSLRDELLAMIRDAVPLVWSTSDIQTLINAYIEDMDCLSGTRNCPMKLSNDDSEGGKLIHAWQELFSLLRSSAEIVGDEIHAILVMLRSIRACMSAQHGKTRWLDLMTSRQHRTTPYSTSLLNSPPPI